MSRVQANSMSSSGGGFSVASTARAPTSGSADASATGGNLSSGKADGVTATWSGRNPTPQAAGGIDQVANTVQQNITGTIVEAAFSFGLVDDIEEVYDRMVRVAQDYFNDFNNDFSYWKNVYVPFLVQDYIPKIIEFEYYIGDGRGLFAPSSPDKDLGRRGQLAAAYIKDIDIAWRTKRRITNQYARGEMQMDDIEAAIRKYQATIDQGISARRIEDIYEDEFNNRAWNRLLIGTNIGLAGTNAASAGYSSAMGAYMSAMQDMANYKTALGNQISAAAGNISQRVFGGS